jgi:hypothetical protein
VALVREPANQYDHNAVSVWDEAKTVQLGYLPRAIAATFAPLLDSGDGQPPWWSGSTGIPRAPASA